MQNTKYVRLRIDCNQALADDNIEKCLSILTEELNVGKYVSELTELKARLSNLQKEWNGGRIAYEEFGRNRNKILHDLLEFVDKTIQPDDISLLSGIHDRILIVACKNSPTNWGRLFPDEQFSHILVICYGETIPREFKNPDIIIFDDLNCPGLLGNKNEMKRLAQEMPLAHLLYVGDAKPGNPFQDSKMKDEQEIFARMGNANSHLSIHGRLNELLEFRRNYGPPLSTVILENMKDKLPLKVFISYSHKDEEWKSELDMHLAAMKRQGLIEVWQDRQIIPGAEWDSEIKQRLEGSHLILFMLSVGFMNSEYIWNTEVPIAMDLYHSGKAKIVPIFTKEIDIKGSPFEKIQGLPRDAKFMVSQPNRDQIVAAVAKELREVVENWGK
jgi:TIR domain/Effector-associated domain 11